MRNLILLVTFSIICIACTPTIPQSANNTAPESTKINKSKKSTAKETNNIIENKKQSQTNNTTISSKSNKNFKNNDPIEKRTLVLKNITSEEERFIDTTYYFLAMEDGQTIAKFTPSTYAAAGNNFNKENIIKIFNQAIEESEKDGYSNCNYFKYFADNFSNFNDSLHQEAIFHLAECYINNNNLEEALFQLETIASEKMNKEVAPKVLVRIGQVYCVSGDRKQAEKYFKKLKKNYPKSIYNKVADCSRF